MNLTDIRLEFPELSHLDPDELAQTIYSQNPEFKDIPYADFAKMVDLEGDKISQLPDRSYLGEVAATVPRTLRSGAAMGLKATHTASKGLGLPEFTRPSDEYIEDVEEELSDPNYRFAKGQKASREGEFKPFIEGMESAGQSMMMMVPGAITGIAKGAPAGPGGAILGGAFGAGLSGGSIFAGAEYYDFMKEAHELLDPLYANKHIAAGTSPEEAHALAQKEIDELASPQAVKSAAAEFVGEGISDVLNMLIMKGGGHLIKPAITANIKAILSKGLARYAVTTGGIAASEIPSEYWTAIQQAKAKAPIHEAAGLEPPDPAEMAKETIKPTAYSSLFFGGAATAGQALTKKKPPKEDPRIPVRAKEPPPVDDEQAEEEYWKSVEEDIIRQREARGRAKKKSGFTETAEYKQRVKNQAAIDKEYSDTGETSSYSPDLAKQINQASTLALPEGQGFQTGKVEPKKPFHKMSKKALQAYVGEGSRGRSRRDLIEMAKYLHANPRQNIIPEDLRSAFETMKEQVGQGAVQRSAGEYGHVIGSTYPDWFKKRHEEDKRPKWSKKEFDSVIAKAESGSNMTYKQRARYQELIDIAEGLNLTDPELAKAADISDLQDKGYDIIGQKVPAAELKKGDKFTGEIDGHFDDYEVKGQNRDGDVIVEDGVKKTLDPFDMVDIEAIKHGEKADSELAYVPTGGKRVAPVRGAEKQAPETVYGKDAKADLEAVKRLRNTLKNTANKKELEALNEEAKKISGAWSYKYGHGMSDSFYTFLENKQSEQTPIEKAIDQPPIGGKAKYKYQSKVQPRDRDRADSLVQRFLILAKKKERTVEEKVEINTITNDLKKLNLKAAFGDGNSLILEGENLGGAHSNFLSSKAEKPTPSDTSEREIPKEDIPEVAPKTPETVPPDVTVSRNESLNGIEISFDKKPDQSVIDQIKAHKFRWSRKKKIWYAKHTDSRMAFANRLKGEPEKKAVEVPKETGAFPEESKPSKTPIATVENFDLSTKKPKEESKKETFSPEVLKKTQVTVRGVRERTGDVIEFQESAFDALNDVNKREDLYKELLDCIS